MSDILFTIQHPADVHLFRNAIQKLDDEGHDVHVFARRKDVNVELLDKYDIDHEVLTGKSSGVLGTAKMQLVYELKLFQRAMAIEPDVMLADGGIAISHISKVLDAPSLVFTDTEHVVDSLVDRRHLIYRFADEVHTPDCYWLDLGTNHRRYPSYHELAYLSPEHFEPDSTIRDELGVEANEPIALLRFVSWDAFHDRGNRGISMIDEVIEYLQSNDVEVFISSERNLPQRYAHLEVDLPVEKIHHLMAESQIFIGESSTMASESAVLGTPAVFISSLQLGYISELEHEYGLAVSLTPNEERYLLDHVKRIIRKDDRHWSRQRQRLLDEKINTTDYILEQIGNHIEGSSGVVEKEQSTQKGETGD